MRFSGKISRNSIWTLCGALGLFALIVPRLITAAPLDSLDSSSGLDDPSERADSNFPGSAYFYSEGAFAPVPGALTIQSEHVMGLDTVQAAPAAIFRGLTAMDSYRALNCLTSAIYYEAANEPDDGQKAVAQVVLNRVRSPHWPNSICGVVYEGSERDDLRCQFSFSCDGSMARLPSATAWARARRAAETALSGQVYRPVGLATHYHTLAVRPSWSSTLQPVAVVGAHIFYKMPGFNGTLPAFRINYLGRETQSGPAPRIWRPTPIAPPEIFGADYIAGGVPAHVPLNNNSAATAPAVAPAPSTSDTLPESTIKPEYRNSGRPLI